MSYFPELAWTLQDLWKGLGQVIGTYWWCMTMLLCTEAFPLRWITARAIDPVLLELVSRVGIPQEIVTDQGTSFLSQTLHLVYILLGIKRIKTTLYQPQTDGLVKRYNQTLKAMLKMRKTGIVGCCICFSFTGRSLTLQKATHPFLFSSIQMREKMEQVTTLVHANMEAAQKRQKDLFDKTTKVRVFQPGQEVSLLLPTTDNKLLAKWQSSQENGICYADTIGRRSRSIMSISSKNGNPKLFKTASSLWLEL